MGVEERVHELLSPIVATMGIELLDVTYGGGSLRLTVDEQAGSITTERLAAVNRMISPILDQHDPVPGRYTLEVSSPGLERPLKRLEHFQRAVGELVALKLVAAREPRRVKGELVEVHPGDGADGPEITIEATEIDGAELDGAELRRVPVSDIESARTVFEWGPAPKPGGSGKARNPRAKKRAAKKPKRSEAAVENADRAKGETENETPAKKSKSSSQLRGAR